MNSITIVGRVATEPVRRETDNGVVCSFRLASGKPHRRGGRMWIDVDAWGNLAGVCIQHLDKGREVVVNGRLALAQWSDRATGDKRERYLIVAHTIEFLSANTRAVC